MEIAVSDFVSRYPKYDVIQEGILVARVCKTCEEQRPIDEYRPRRSKGGLVYSRECRACRTSRQMGVYNSDPKRRLQVIFAQLKLKAKSRGYPFTIDFDFLWSRANGGRCEVTGIPFDLSCDFRSPFFPSVDQIEPQKGYTPDNARVVVAIYNFAKNCFTDDDVMRMAKALVEKGPHAP